MRRDEINVAGNLWEELQEADKLVVDNEYIEAPGTWTTTCGAFLSLVCC